MNFIKKNILKISMYFFVGCLVMLCFIGVFPTLLSRIRMYCSFSNEGEFFVSLNGGKYIVSDTIFILFTIYCLLWLLINKMQKVKIFNSIMVCSLLIILHFMVDLLSIPMIIFTFVTLVIVCIYVNKKTPYIKGNKMDVLDYAGFSFSLLLILLRVNYIWATITYLILVVILFIFKKGVYFDVSFVFSFVSIFTMLPSGIQTYVINSNTGEIYKTPAEIINVIDMMHKDFEVYKNVLEVKLMLNFQFYLFLLLMIILLLLVSFKYRKILHKKSDGDNNVL